MNAKIKKRPSLAALLKQAWMDYRHHP